MIDISQHLPMVRALVRRRPPTHGACDAEDLVQAGMWGVWRASLKYDPTRGTTFATYARRWATAYIDRVARNTSETVRPPTKWTWERRNALGLRCESLDAPRGASADRTGHDVTPAPANDGTPPPELAAAVVRTLVDVGAEFEVSRERARQLRVRAFDKLRRTAELKGLREAPF